MKEKFYVLLLEMIEEHPRTFELFAFTIIFLLIQICLESLGLVSNTTDFIMMIGGGVVALAIGLGALNDAV